ncbi:hypothetical protein VTO42DRAFT_4812 [Malbranchea cinnamomea]
MSPPLSVNAVPTNGTTTAPLTVDGVPALRTKTQMPLGVAAASNSDMFKSPHCFTKPKAKQWDHRLSTESKARKPSSLKQAAQYLKLPNIISLGGGLPSPEYFPFDALSVKIPVAPHFSEEGVHQYGQTVTSGKHDIREGKSEYDLEIALNYGQSIGAPPLLRFVTEHTEIVHNPPYSDWRCCLTAGSTAAWDATLRLFCERGDYVLVEEYTFCTAMETALPLGLRLAPVKIDEQGLIPEALDEMLSTWDETVRGGRKPFVLYTIPSGQNPTGATQSADRRKAVYKVAQKHDVIIVEDEPYFFLQMQPYKGSNTPPDPAPASIEEFLNALVPSFLSLDVDGRVVRLESFSKVISPGSRVGWVVASEQVIERFARHFECSTQNPSGMSQLILYKLLNDSWGHEGYFKWLINLRMEYTKRRDYILDACEKYLPTGVASWHPPDAGMFHWIKVDWHRHPDASKGIRAVEEAIFKAAIAHDVLVSCGSWFIADNTREPTELFFRATFAAAPGDKIQEAIRRFGDALREQFNLG